MRDEEQNKSVGEGTRDLNHREYVLMYTEERI